MEETIIELKKHSDSLINLLGFTGESVVALDDGAVVVNIEIDTPALLIGRGGEGLDALQHVIRLLASEMLYERDLDLVVDIAGYRRKKAENLVKTARERAYQVVATGLPEVFPTMSSYERRIIHMTCANIADIITESEGEGRERRVVIKSKKT